MDAKQSAVVSRRAEQGAPELPQENQPVAVLGGAGFIGRHLLKKLQGQTKKRYSVGGFSSASEAMPGVFELGGRVTQQVLESLPELPSVIFHLAGGASVAKSVQNPRQDFELTVQSTLEVLEYLRTRNPQCPLVYVSSAAVYGNASRGSAEERLEPSSPYGLHKKIAEELCRFYAQRHGLCVTIVRPFSVYGPGLRKQLLWDALQKCDVGTASFFGTGQELRDWIYVEDLAEILVWAGATASAFSFRVMDAGRGVGVSVAEVLGKLFDIYAPGQKPQFTEGAKSGDPAHLVSRTPAPKLQRYLKTDLDTGLRRYVEWYRKECAK